METSIFQLVKEMFVNCVTQLSEKTVISYISDKNISGGFASVSISILSQGTWSVSFICELKLESVCIPERVFPAEFALQGM